MFSSPFHALSEIELQPAAITSASAVLPDPRAPTIATSPALRGMSLVMIHEASLMRTWEITCEGIAPFGGSMPTHARPCGSIQAWRSESNVSAPLTQVYRSSAGRPIVARSCASQPLRQGLQPSYRMLQLLGGKVLKAQPKLALRRTAGEDDVRKLLDLLTDRLVRGLLQS